MWSKGRNGLVGLLMDKLHGAMRPGFESSLTIFILRNCHLLAKSLSCVVIEIWFIILPQIQKHNLSLNSVLCSNYQMKFTFIKNKNFLELF